MPSYRIPHGLGCSFSWPDSLAVPCEAASTSEQNWQRGAGLTAIARSMAAVLVQCAAAVAVHLRGLPRQRQFRRVAGAVHQAKGLTGGQRRLVRDPSDAPRAAAGLHRSARGHRLGRHACALRGSASDGAAWPCRRRSSLDLRRRSGCMQVSSAADGKTLAFNALKDPCPSRTKKQVQFCKGFDYGDIERRKTTRLWPSMSSRTLALRSPRSRLSSVRDSITGT